MKLALGTVQFGLDYGAFRSGQRPGLRDLKNILLEAESLGIDLLDTAHAYGESEAVLGAADAANRFAIISKIPRIVDRSIDASNIIEYVRTSLSRLSCSSIRGMLLHRGADLLEPAGRAIWEGLSEAKSLGLVDRIGVSIYSPEELEAICERFDIEVAQVPYSVFDQRIATSGLLDRMSERGVEVRVRSVFLQGFALAELDCLPPHLRPHRKTLELFQNAAASLGMTPLEASLAHVKFDDRIAYVVVGVQNLLQFMDMARAWNRVDHATAFEECASEDLDLIDASRWSS